MSRKSRGLRPEERELWRRVAQTAQPLRPQRRQAAPIAPLRSLNEPSRPALKVFRIGQAANVGSRGRDVVPAPGVRLPRAPVLMDARSFTRMKRGKLSPEARLDLHGMTLAQAFPALTGFVLQTQATGKRLVLVITGKGRDSADDGPIPVRRGVLRHQVPQWLARPPLSGAVLQVTQAHQRHGGAGALYIYLRRRR